MCDPVPFGNYQELTGSVVLGESDRIHHLVVIFEVETGQHGLVEVQHQGLIRELVVSVVHVIPIPEPTGEHVDSSAHVSAQLITNGLNCVEDSDLVTR